jgi:PilZ domain
MKPGERRYTPRLRLRIPITVRSLDSGETSARIVQSDDVSARGIYFATDLPLKVGAPVQLIMRMPEEIAGRSLPEWRCHGRVVHVDTDDVPPGESRVGVEIQYYEVVKS